MPQRPEHVAKTGTPSDDDGQHEQENVEPTEQQDYASFSEDLDIESQQESASASHFDETKARITLLEEELNRTKDQMMRAVAEAENGRKRALKDREDASRFAVSSFSRDILGVADNLRRAIEAVPIELMDEHPQVKNLTDGILATERELLRCFEKHGIKKTDPINEMFDPNFHEVMFETPMPDKENGIIIQVIEPGYTLNGRILRPARVGVAKNDGGGQSPMPTEPGQNINTEV